MSEDEKRYIELTFRLNTLNQMKDKLKEEMSHEGMAILAKALDNEIEYIQAGTLSVLKNWILEVEEEHSKLGEKVFVGFMESAFEKMKKEFEK